MISVYGRTMLKLNPRPFRICDMSVLVYFQLHVSSGYDFEYNKLKCVEN